MTMLHISRHAQIDWSVKPARECKTKLGGGRNMPRCNSCNKFVALQEEDPEEHALEVEEVSSERTQPDHTPPGQKPPPARYRKTYYGFELTVKVTCKGCDLEEELV